MLVRELTIESLKIRRLGTGGVLLLPTCSIPGAIAVADSICRQGFLTFGS